MAIVVTKLSYFTTYTDGPLLPVKTSLGDFKLGFREFVKPGPGPNELYCEIIQGDWSNTGMCLNYSPDPVSVDTSRRRALREAMRTRICGWHPTGRYAWRYEGIPYNYRIKRLPYNPNPVYRDRNRKHDFVPKGKERAFYRKIRAQFWAVYFENYGRR